MSQKKTILIIDDDKDIAETLSSYLALEGFKVRTAFDGQQGLEAARREQPDLIVLDVMLPGRNGYQVARSLREDWRQGRISRMPSILMLTAREEALQTWSGSDVFMYKPFDIDELMGWVRSLTRAAVAVPPDGNRDRRGLQRKTLFGIG